MFRVRAAPPPGYRYHAVPGGGSGLSLLKDTTPREQAAGWAFLTFMTSAGSTAAFARATGYTPVRPAALRDPALRHFLETHPNAGTALAQAAAVRPTDAILAAPFVNRHIEGALSRVLFEGAAVSQTCADLARSLTLQVSSPQPPPTNDRRT